MTAIFADTSGFLAFLNPAEPDHAAARRCMELAQHRLSPLLTTSYVLIETYALLGRRLGAAAMAAFRADIAPLLDVVWVDQPLHDAALDWLLQRQRRNLSLVDAVSFTLMRQRGLVAAIAFDAHFAAEGFHLPA